MLNDVSENLRKLSRGPNEIARCFSGYVINGYRFHTKQRDAKRKTQNSGVTLAAITESFSSTKDENPITQSITYYALITEIIEVDYYGKLKFVLFRCDWFEVEEENMGWLVFTSTRDVTWMILLYWLLKFTNASTFKILLMQINIML